MVNITLQLEWSYSKYALLALFQFFCTSFFSSASVLESFIIGVISGLTGFWLDKLFALPAKIRDKVEKSVILHPHQKESGNKNVTGKTLPHQKEEGYENNCTKLLHKTQREKNLKGVLEDMSALGVKK